MCGLAGNLSDLRVMSSPCDILLCPRQFGLRYASRVGVAGSRILSPCLVPGQDTSDPRDGSIRTGWVWTCRRGCCEMLVFRVCGMRQNLQVFSLYRNPDLDDRIFYCLLTSMVAVQAEGVRASCLFVGDFYGHPQA